MQKSAFFSKLSVSESLDVLKFPNFQLKRKKWRIYVGIISWCAQNFMNTIT